MIDAKQEKIHNPGLLIKVLLISTNFHIQLSFSSCNVMPVSFVVLSLLLQGVS